MNAAQRAYEHGSISFAFLGAGFLSAGPYAPVILNIAIPVGAIVFLVRRRSLIAKNAGQIVAKPDA
ncbi:hypothetical protein [Trinickia dinghuensis]|uniref:hypothetical protein n=1 Tax=Trinickia dinghuensis TaxID=2291023 RepID=UPI000E1F9CF3|nr:hypothetical protein [Trinickia dinghuensis]